MRLSKIVSRQLFWFVLIILGTLAVFAGESRAAQLQLSWTDNSNNETGFKIDRKTGTSGTFAQIASVGAGATTYTDSTVTAGTNYCYRVYAFNSAGNSTYTPEVCGTAAAAVQTFSLIVTKGGNGGGTMTSSPAGISCTNTCTGTFNSGTAVTLTAAPAAGSIFASWAGTGCAATTAAVIVTMSANRNCTATFNTQSGSANTISSNISNGAVLRGSSVVWTATATGSPIRVEFLIDNVLAWTETASPYQFNGDPSGRLNTRTLSNASHQLKIRAVYGNNSTAEKTITVTVSNGSSQVSVVDSQPATISLNARVGVFRPSTGQWFLDFNGNGVFDDCSVDVCVSGYGSSAMLPVVADWGGTGRTSVGVFEPNTGTWHLDNGNGKWDACSSTGDICVTTYGSSGSFPVVRELSSEKLLVGTFQSQVKIQNVTKQGVWNFDVDGDGNVDPCSIDQCIENFGQAGDLPIVGDWGGTGGEEIGFFRPQTQQWYLDVNGNGKWDGATVDRQLGPYGLSTDLPIVGDWDGTGKVRIGAYRPSTGQWFLDLNGNGKWDGSPLDKVVGPFGQVGDLPVVGNW